MIDYGKAVLEVAKRKGALKYGEFKLSAGGVSNFYFDGRLLTLDPEGAHLVGRAMLPLVLESGASAIAGPTVGADPIVAVVAVLSQIQNTPVRALIVRTEAKSHGRGRLIEGHLIPGEKVVVVDDACTSGKSLAHAIDAVEAAACEVVRVVCILDRREGGSDEIRKRGYGFTALLEADEQGHIQAAAQAGT